MASRSVGATARAHGAALEEPAQGRGAALQARAHGAALQAQTHEAALEEPARAHGAARAAHWGLARVPRQVLARVREATRSQRPAPPAGAQEPEPREVR